MRLLLALALLVSQSPQQRGSNQSKGRPEARKTAVASQPANTVGRASSGQPSASPAQGQDERDEKPWLDTMELLTLGLLLVAGFQAILFVRQLAKMDGSLKDSARSAKASEDTLKQLSDQFAAEQRPWVSVQIGATAMQINRDECVLPIKVVMRNSGNTPALRARVFARFAFHTAGSIAPVEMQSGLVAEMISKTDRLTFTLFPDVEEAQQRSAFIDGEDLKLWREKTPRGSQTTVREDRLLLLGAVVYFDTSGDQHHTGFILEAYQPLMESLLTINPHYDPPRRDGGGGFDNDNSVPVVLIPSTFGSGIVD
jgi:hypothetical protein